MMVSKVIKIFMTVSHHKQVNDYHKSNPGTIYHFQICCCQWRHYARFLGRPINESSIV